jgi:ferrous iron transport protein B
MDKKHRLSVALAGNANVGKSVIFNQLTGLNQIVGNWPGKTVERAEGTLVFKGYKIGIIDLPGVYSLSTYSMEEIVSRDYIATERPDIIVDVVDASALERNLYFTIQLLEFESPIVVALNQMDFAAKKGIKIDVQKLSAMLGVPVVPMVATSGVGTQDLLCMVIDVIEGKIKFNPMKVKYSREIERHIEKLALATGKKLPELCQVYPARWVAVKLLERDQDVEGKLYAYSRGEEVARQANESIEKIERSRSEPSPVVIASERYKMANGLAKAVMSVRSPPQITLEQKLDSITTHKILGYPILAAVLAAMFAVVFLGGNFLSDAFGVLFYGMFIPAVNSSLLSFMPSWAVNVVVNGFLGGVIAGVTIVLPYIIPFYILLAVLEDSGYLPRAAFLMDNVMHKIGLHGKAFIPLMLGYGCNVPACIGCRIMETDRERFLAGFVVVLIPCAARTVVILGLVGRFVGLHAALALYVFDLALVFALGRIAFKALPGEPVGLIMEMPSYKKPMMKNVLLKTWSRTKDFVYIAFPLIIAGSVVLTALSVTGLLTSVAQAISPLTSGWLGLPSEAGIPLLFGVLRKELTLVLLSELLPLGSLTSVQMIVFALVTMIYIPCVATVAALFREFGWKRAVSMIIIDVVLAVVLGGIAFRLLSFFMK